jgi:acyl-coenzyme A synthetase/AMP-(fatty) acid ligase
MPALISHLQPKAIVAYEQGHAIAAHEYLASVRHMAALLPERGYVLNLCANRYHFAVAMGAALLRQQPMLLPSTRSPAMLMQLSRQYPGLYALVDQEAEAVDLPQIRVLAATQEPDAAPAPFEVPRFDADQIAAYIFTSGSTGLPVPHAKRWGELVHNAQAEGERVRFHLFGKEMPVSAFTATGTVPAQHMYGLESTVMLPMQNEAALDASHPFYPADITQALQRVPSPRVLVTTPFHLRTLVESKTTAPTLGLLLSATAALSPQLAEQAEKVLGAPLLEIYGCTEIGQVATRRTTSTPIWETYKGIEIVQQTDAQNEAVFLATAPYVDGSVALGDVLELCTSTSFKLLGRQADMVNIAGKRTSLAYLNHELNSIKGVSDGAFYLHDSDAPDDQARVRRPMAFVVAPALNEAELIGALRKRLDPVFMPRPIFFVDHLPRNSTGKLPQQALAELAQAMKARAHG